MISVKEDVGAGSDYSNQIGGNIGFNRNTSSPEIDPINQFQNDIGEIMLQGEGTSRKSLFTGADSENEESHYAKFAELYYDAAMDTCGAVWPFEVFGRMEAGANLHQERRKSMSSIYTSDNFVIYTANNGNPNTEYYAPPPGQQKTYIVSMSNVIPAGTTITAAWYALLDNIGNSMTCFAHIAVAPSPPNSIELTLGGNTDQPCRMRLRVYVQAG